MRLFRKLKQCHVFRIACNKSALLLQNLLTAGRGGGIFLKSGQNLGKNRPQKYQVSKKTLYALLAIREI